MAIWGALGTTLFFLFLNIGQGKVIGTYRAIISKKTDRRVRLLGEMINSMRIIKMYVWEGFFLQKLMRYRKEEMKKHRQKLYFYGFFDSILKSSSKYLIAITISIYFSRKLSQIFFRIGKKLKVTGKIRWNGRLKFWDIKKFKNSRFQSIRFVCSFNVFEDHWRKGIHETRPGPIVRAATVSFLWSLLKTIFDSFSCLRLCLPNFSMLVQELKTFFFSLKILRRQPIRTWRTKLSIQILNQKLNIRSEI